MNKFIHNNKNNIRVPNNVNNNIDNKNINSSGEKKIINKINKIPFLICCKGSINKIREKIEKIFTRNEKSNSIINVESSNSEMKLKCKIANKFFKILFELHISTFKDAKNHVLIKPELIKGNKAGFLEIFGKFKNQLLN